MAAHVFISYRRSDTDIAAGRLAADLRTAFGEASVFRDKEDIGAGTDWTRTIRDAIGPRGTMLVLIGERWLERDVQGNRRLDNPNDVHANEIAGALQLGCHVIPVVVGNARMPHADELPERLRPLAQRQALKLRDDEWQGFDLPRVVEELERRGFRRGAMQRFGALGVVGLLLGALAVAALIGGDDEADTVGGAIAFGIVGAVLAAMAWRKAKAQATTDKGIAAAGIACGVIAAIAGINVLDLSSLRSSGSAAARLTPPVAHAGNIAGRWFDGSGGLVDIEQNGEQVALRHQNPANMFHGLVLAGRFSGNVLQAQAMIPAGPVNMHMTLLPDGRTLSGSVSNPMTGGVASQYMLKR